MSWTTCVSSIVSERWSFVAIQTVIKSDRSYGSGNLERDWLTSQKWLKASSSGFFEWLSHKIGVQQRQMTDLLKVVVEAMVPRSKIISIRIRTDAQIALTCRKIRRTCRFLSKRATFPTSFYTQNHFKYSISDRKWLLLTFFCKSVWSNFGKNWCTSQEALTYSRCQNTKNRICTRHFEGYQKSVAPINSWGHPKFLPKVLSLR